MQKNQTVLVVSFGTTYVRNCEMTIGAIENAIARAYPDWRVERAFTSGMVRRTLLRREGLAIDSVEDALKRLAGKNVSSVIVQPTHVMNGIENDAMAAAVEKCRGEFDSIACGRPLLTAQADYVQLVAELAPEMAGRGENDAMVFMGHGTPHPANSAYAALQYAFDDAECANVFVGTVEGYPDIDAVLRRMSGRGIKKVRLQPLMIVAGDHARNDMAGDAPESWRNVFERAGFEVECVMRGLGENAAVQQHFVRHVAQAMADAKIF